MRFYLRKPLAFAIILSTIPGCILLIAMVLRPSDLPADETPEMEMDFAADNPQTVSGGVDMGRRRFLQVVLTGAGYAAVNNVIAEEPTVGKGSNTKVQPVVVTKVSEEAQAKRDRKSVV